MSKNKKTNKTQNMDPYSIDRLHKVPFWIKVLLLKYWFFGAIYYFMFMGIFSQNSQGWQQWVAIFAGVVCGAFHDVVINKIIMLWETDKHEGQHFSMIISKKYYAFIINVVYYVFVFVIGYIVVNFTGPFFVNTLKWKYAFGQEALSFALIILLIDCFFLLIKYQIKRLIKYIKSRKNSSNA